MRCRLCKSKNTRQLKNQGEVRIGGATHYTDEHIVRCMDCNRAYDENKVKKMIAHMLETAARLSYEEVTKPKGKR